MSARNRRKAIDRANPFAKPLDIRDADAELFGAIEDADRHYQAIETIDIFEIYPDLTQPRRAVPAVVRQEAQWDGTADGLPLLFATWLTAVQAEKGGIFELSSHLVATNDTNRSTENARDLPIGPIEESFLKLTDLAGSILRDGLTNPITVARQGDRYRLETGERRWLAYALLFMQLDDEAWRLIPARQVSEVDKWRQAAENNARSDLNAIARARQLAILLMELRREHYGDQFQPYEHIVADGSDRRYYAQVADGEVFRVPRGTGEKLLAATGLKVGTQIRQYRRLLELPDIVWQIADDLNWTENFLRELLKKARNNHELTQLAAYEAHKVGYTVTTVTLPSDFDGSHERLNLDDRIPSAPGSKGYFSGLYKTLRKAGRGRPIETHRAIETLEQHRRWVSEELARLKRLL